MQPIYSDYYWKDGRPVGKGKNNGESGYKILSDPYFKWISIEKYVDSEFKETLYDSKIFDFRTLKPQRQNIWQKKQIRENLYLINNQDDRVIILEEYTFRERRCVQCIVKSCHGLPICSQKIYYKDFGDKTNGVALFDRNQHLVMYKIYDLDPKSGEFTEIIKEEWNMAAKPPLFFLS